MKNKVKQIMKKYEKDLKKIEQKYETETIDTSDLDEKIINLQDYISKLEFDKSENGMKSMARAKQNLDEAIKKKHEIESNLKEDKEKKEKIKNSTVILKSGRKVKMTEKAELDKSDLKNKAIRDLTSESKNISNLLLEKQQELESKRKEWQEFKYQYEKDENGNLKPEPINKSEIEKIHKEYDKIKKDMVELNKMQEECDKYLTELKAPTKKDIEFMNAWRDTATVNPQPSNPQPSDPQPSNPQPSNPQPSNPQPSNPQPSNPQPSNPQPSNPQPSNPQPSNPQPNNPQPSNPQPSDPQPSNQQPSNPQPSNPQPNNPQPSNPQPKDVKINIGKEVTFSFEKDGQTIEGKLDLKDLKKQLDDGISIDIARKIRNLQGLKAEDKDYDIKMEKINKLAKKVNPMVFEVLYKLDKEIGKDQPEYLVNYLKTIINDDPSMLKTDIVYDENQYKRRNIFDRIKALPFIDKALNGKQINKIEEYAEKDETNKMARIIRINKKETKKIGNGDEQKNHSDFVEKLKEISEMQIDDPDDQLTPEQLQEKRIRKEQESSTAYIDRFGGKDNEGR